MFTPSITFSTPEVPVRLTLLNVTPVKFPLDPPVKITPLAVAVRVDVPALKVKPVVVAKLTGVPPLNVTVELPRLIVRVLLLLDDRDVAVMLKLLVVKVPLVTVMLLVVVKAS